MADAQEQHWQFFRFSSLGFALLDTVDEMIRDGTITGELANIIMTRFDESLASALSKKVEARCSFTGKCATFNYLEDVYRFSLKNVRFKMEAGVIVEVPSLKVIAVKSHQADDIAASSSMKSGGKGAGKKANANLPKPLAEMAKTSARNSPAPGTKGKAKSKLRRHIDA